LSQLSRAVGGVVGGKVTLSRPRRNFSPPHNPTAPALSHAACVGPRDVQRLAFAARFEGRTLRWARERLGVRSARHGGVWWWALPGGGAEG